MIHAMAKRKRYPTASKIEAKHAPSLMRPERLTDSIVVSDARDRMLDLFERDQLPANVKSSLSSAIAGDMQSQWLLFQAMIDTWPRLQKGLREIKVAARKAPWTVEPWAERGDDPTPEQEKLAQEVESMIWKMKPDHIRGTKGIEGTIEALVDGYFFGHAVIEPQWALVDGEWVPTTCKVLPARHYGYPLHGDNEDMLMLDRSGRWGCYSLEEFPPHRFLVAVNGGHPGHPSTAAPLRALAAYWMASVFGLRWGMTYAQLFGVPFRWATYADDSDRAEVQTMLQNIGTAGWAAFKSGTELNLIESKASGAQLPQWKLMEMANEECDIFILGQTLTSSVGDSGSRALGDVHMGVRKEHIEGICDFVGEVLSHQLIPAWHYWNYKRERLDLPTFWAKWEDEVDHKSLAERDQIIGLIDGKIPVAKAWLYERHGIPMPADGEDIFQPPRAAEATVTPAQDAPTDPQTQPGRMDAKHRVQAAATDPKKTIETLTDNVIQGLTGISAQWLANVKPVFLRLGALAMSGQVTDADFIAALEKLQSDMPELFGALDSDTLEDAFERAIGSGLLAGATERIKGNVHVTG